jgi:hypothetical protein
MRSGIQSCQFALAPGVFELAECFCLVWRMPRGTERAAGTRVERSRCLSSAAFGEIHMTNDNYNASGMTGVGKAAAIADGHRERSTSVVTEFVDAARSAAESLLEEQKQQVSERVSGIGEALRCAADSLAHSQNRVVARYVERAADQIAEISRTVRAQRWNEVVADTEALAKRQPILFVVSTVAAGFLAGRFLWAATSGQPNRSGASREISPNETTLVTAAVSSGSKTAAGELSCDGPASSGVIEAP